MTHPVYEAFRPVTPLAGVVLAANPGPMTLDGTNSWVLRAPDAREAIVVDPGPDDTAHLAAVAAAAGRVATILLTHGHPDHSDGARRLHETTGAPVRALDPAHRLGSEGLVEGDVVAAGGVEVRVWATPGHSSDSL
ncbi:MAG: beta-lactamase domain protein, partial [Pseudonocardiales bacterium]|nr:beta-lactamase domain protein [Pseudonocardiales bacterium]